VSLAFHCVFIFSCAITHLVLLGKDDTLASSSSHNASFVDAIKHSPSSVIVIVICFFSVWSIIGLAGFHTYLATTNLTTNEDIKGAFSSKRNHENFNPFSRGNFLSNFLEVLCSPMSPSLLDSTGIVTEQYLIANSLVPGDVETGAGLGKTYGTVLDPKPYPVQQKTPQHQGINGQQQVLYNQQRQMVQTQTSTTELSTSNVQMHNNGGGAVVMAAAIQTTAAASAAVPEQSPSDLDQTTMIGSALDLDSLNGDLVASATSILSDNDMMDNGSSTLGTSHSVGGGSQVGLMSAPAQSTALEGVGTESNVASPM
jgi:hypothetical protein